MDFRDSTEDAAYREQVRAWLTDAVAGLGPEPATISERLPTGGRGSRGSTRPDARAGPGPRRTAGRGPRSCSR